MKKGSYRTAYIFLAPFLLLFLAFFLFPIVYAFIMSLQTSRGLSSVYVGFHNYEVALHDTDFWSAIARMVYFGVIQVTTMLLAALVSALLLDSPFAHARRFYRLLYFLPYAVPGVVGAILWGYLYAPTIGPLQAILNALGLHISLLNTNIILYSIMNMVSWGWIGYNMTIYTSGLAAISPQLYEAARMDGANELWLAIRVKVPLLRPLLVLTSVMSIIGTLQIFSEPYILSSLTSIPFSYTPNLDIYNTAFSFGAFNYAATLAVLLTVITCVASSLFLYVIRRGQEGRPS